MYIFKYFLLIFDLIKKGNIYILSMYNICIGEKNMRRQPHVIQTLKIGVF